MKPILFNTEMVRAIPGGRKIATRRLVKPKPPENARLELVGDMRHAMDLSIEIPGPDDHRIYTPPCLPGDILYVRETWGDYRECQKGGEGYYYLYRADYPDGATTYQYPDGAVCDLPKWHPSIHMPKEAARIFLRVTDLRVERLQEPFFCQGDVVHNLAAEGIDIGNQCRECTETYGNPCCIDEESECGILDDVRDDFVTLWDSTIKPADLSVYGWAANPWVWVIKFERITEGSDSAAAGEYADNPTLAPA